MDYVTPEVEAIEKMGAKIKFLYFMRDLGIKSAHPVAIREWVQYMMILSDISVGG